MWCAQSTFLQDSRVRFTARPDRLRTRPAGATTNLTREIDRNVAPAHHIRKGLAPARYGLARASLARAASVKTPLAMRLVSDSARAR